MEIIPVDDDTHIDKKVLGFSEISQKTIDIFHGYDNLLTGIFVSNPFPLKPKNA